MKDYKISIIRTLAMISIVLCHIFQEQGMGIALWLNLRSTSFSIYVRIFIWTKKD